MNDQELQALKGAFGFEHITDPLELRAAIEQRVAHMNVVDRAAMNIDIGRRLQELEALVPGARYSPATWSLLTTAILLGLLASLAFWWVRRTSVSLILRIPVGLFGALAFLVTWRAAARIIYRLANKRDM